MKILITLLKPLSFLPALLMMYIIFSFSAQTGEVSGELSYKISYQIVETKNELLNTGKSYDELAYEAESIHYYVRKAAHMTEYCLLAIAISFPLYVYRIRGFWLFILAGIICVGFAGLDEYHQSFVSGRTPGIRDVGFDSLGALVGILLVQLFCWSSLHNPGSPGKSRRKTRRLKKHRRRS
ncbi:MAG TPA: VanZ family protein [Candidatus Blautia intestinavium]|nr:VanZ family protein [Candidatus Blautia intestinavium]